MKTKIIFLVTFIFLFLIGNVQAGLIEGYFEGTININGSQIGSLEEGGLFAGSFIYETDAPVTSYSPNTFYTHNNLINLSFALFGSDNIYTYANDSPETPLYGRYNDNGNYSLDWDGISGANLNGGLQINGLPPELLLNFEDTFVADPLSPILAPNANNLTPGNNYWGSVLYLWLEDNNGNNAQINCNISDLNLHQYPAPVPEPATVLLFGSGLVGLVGARIRKKRK